jgi:hypothetical protein
LINSNNDNLGLHLLEIAYKIYPKDLTALYNLQNYHKQISKNQKLVDFYSTEILRLGGKLE